MVPLSHNTEEQSKRQIAIANDKANAGHVLTWTQVDHSDQQPSPLEYNRPLTRQAPADESA
jgi:hypothetical protein